MHSSVRRLLCCAAVVGAGALPATACAKSETATTATATTKPATATVSRARKSDDPAARLTAAFDAARVETRTPGAAAAVLDRGRVVWSYASGLAVDPSADPLKPGAAPFTRAVPFSTATIVPIASATKQYTAVVILRLYEQGKLRLTDKVSRWLPAVPGASSVTVRQLLNHTSGYPDVEDDPRVTRYTSDPETYDPNHRWTRAGLIALTRAPAFTPGSRFSYSNTNYLLLGTIAERAGGAPFATLLDRFVLTPLGLDETWMTHRGLQLSRVSHGYYRTREMFADTWSGARSIPTDAFGSVWTDGGIAATAADVGRFANGLYYADRLLKPATLRTMIAYTRTTNRNGLGTKRFELGEGTGRWQGHTGAYGGYTSMVATDLDSGLTIVVLADQLVLDPVGIAAADLWLSIASAL